MEGVSFYFTFCNSVASTIPRHLRMHLAPAFCAVQSEPKRAVEVCRIWKWRIETAFGGKHRGLLQPAHGHPHARLPSRPTSPSPPVQLRRRGAAGAAALLPPAPPLPSGYDVNFYSWRWKRKKIRYKSTSNKDFSQKIDPFKAKKGWMEREVTFHPTQTEDSRRKQATPLCFTTWNYYSNLSTCLINVNLSLRNFFTPARAHTVFGWHLDGRPRTPNFGSPR